MGTTITAGTRVHWAGDFSNPAQTGTVEYLDGAFMWVRWDGADKSTPQPVALLSTPRWKVVPCEATALTCDVFQCATHTKPA